MSLCEVCKSIDLSRIIQNYRFSISISGRNQPPIGWLHHKTYSDLRSSAANCPCCALFFQESNADPDYPDKPPINESDCVELCAVTGDRWPRRNGVNGDFLLGLRVRVGSPTGSGVSYSHVLDVWIKDYSSPALANLVLPRPVGPVEDTSMIRKWLTTCVANHPLCKLKARNLEDLLAGEMVPLPTRVIYVGPSDGSQDPQLLETNGLRGVYLTLSHCWGTGTVTRTTRSNLSSQKTSIPFAGLSKNFRDAILVTRRLGLQYLWIDSLCIVQDCTKDWDIESSRMAQIYSTSTLTISAATSSSADEGFLKARIPPEDCSVRIAHPGQPGAGVDDSFYICKPQSDFQTDVEHGSLQKRGWTLQERLLSRRNVFFGRDQLHWECQSVRWSESTRLVEQEFTGILAGVSSLRSLSSLQTDDFANIFKLWYALVELYTKRELTNSDDKLPALSGLAKVISGAILGGLGDSYVAGLWRQDLPRGLLWNSYGREPAHQLKVRAPSWSWISHDGRIQSAYEMDHATVEITNVTFSIRVAGLDPFGRVSEGKLTFRGYIKAIPIISRCGPDYQDLDVIQLYVYTNALLKDEWNRFLGRAILDEPNNVEIARTTIYCVPIRHPGASALAYTAEIEAILLCQVPGQEEVYTRVGTAVMKATAAQATTQPTPCQKFFQGVEKRRITII